MIAEYIWVICEWWGIIAETIILIIWSFQLWGGGGLIFGVSMLSNGVFYISTFEFMISTWEMRAWDLDFVWLWAHPPMNGWTTHLKSFIIYLMCIKSKWSMDHSGAGRGLWTEVMHNSKFVLIFLPSSTYRDEAVPALSLIKRI